MVAGGGRGDRGAGRGAVDGRGQSSVLGGVEREGGSAAGVAVGETAVRVGESVRTGVPESVDAEERMQQALGLETQRVGGLRAAHQIRAAGMDRGNGGDGFQRQQWWPAVDAGQGAAWNEHRGHSCSDRDLGGSSIGDTDGVTVSDGISTSGVGSVGGADVAGE